MLYRLLLIDYTARDCMARVDVDTLLLIATVIFFYLKLYFFSFLKDADLGFLLSILNLNS